MKQLVTTRDRDSPAIIRLMLVLTTSIHELLVVPTESRGIEGKVQD